MIRDNQRLINRLTLIIDGFVIVVSYLFAYFLKFESGLLLYDEGLSVQTYMTALYFLVPGYLILYSKLDLYSTRRASGRKRELLNVIKANTLGALIFMMILYLINQPDFSRQMIFIFWGVCICLETAVRNMMRALMMFWWKKGYNLKYVLLIGYSGSAESYINKVLLNPQWGYVIRGILDDNVERGTEYKGIKVLGTIDNLSLILPENTVFRKEVAACPEEPVHEVLGVEAVEARSVAAPEQAFEGPASDPCVRLAAGSVKQLLYLGEELAAGAVAEGRGHEGHNFLIETSADLVHEPGRIPLQEILRLVAGCVFFECIFRHRLQIYKKCFLSLHSLSGYRLRQLPKAASGDGHMLLPSGEFCGCVETGRQARLRILCPVRVGSSPTTRTKYLNN